MTAPDHFDIAIVGGGVVGLATAYKLAIHPVFKNRTTVLIERHAGFGQETSSRNSEVIHAGIYYPQHSLKASLCVDGREQLYSFCRHHDVPYKQTGKLIFAGAGQEHALDKIAAQAERNGIDNLRHLDASKVKSMEPALAAGSALFSPASGIVNCHAYMQKLLDLAQNQGLIFSPLTSVLGVAKHARGFLVTASCQDSPYKFTCEKFVNAAGLSAQQVAAGIADFPAHAIPAQKLVKGNYFSLQGKAPFRHLIYPVPEQHLKGLGVHVTLDMAGQVRFGPDTQEVTTLDYDVDGTLEPVFRDAIRHYFPGIDSRTLVPAYSGIRPKLASANAIADFVIQPGTDTGFAGLVQLFGIESPGLTASLAIADHVCNALA